MLSRRRFISRAAGGLLLLSPAGGYAQEGAFLSAAQAARQLFRDLVSVEELTVPATPELRQRIRALLPSAPSLWESSYDLFRILRGGGVRAFVVVVEEIGKHRPITFAVGVTPAGAVHDAVVLAYREPYGGEIREPRFLRQYAGKGLGDPLRPYRDIRNISGATLSVEATGRAVKKAIAVLKAAGEIG